jgi:predicted RecA/RadA family phage recombinase
MANLGNVVTLIAPQTVKENEVVVVGSIFGIAAHKADKDKPVDCHVVGIFDLTKPENEEWVQGDLVYWNKAGKKATKTADTNMKIGAAISPVIPPEGGAIKTWQVRLSGNF